jgi:hypothetical protein
MLFSRYFIAAKTGLSAVKVGVSQSTGFSVVFFPISSFDYFQIRPEAAPKLYALSLTVRAV